MPHVLKMFKIYAICIQNMLIPLTFDSEFVDKFSFEDKYWNLNLIHTGAQAVIAQSFLVLAGRHLAQLSHSCTKISVLTSRGASVIATLLHRK